MDVDSDSESVVFSTFSEEHPSSSYSPMSTISLRESMQANILYRRTRTITPTDIPSQLVRKLNGSVVCPFFDFLERYLTGRKHAPPMAEVIESELAISNFVLLRHKGFLHSPDAGSACVDCPRTFN